MGLSNYPDINGAKLPVSVNRVKNIPLQVSSSEVAYFTSLTSEIGLTSAASASATQFALSLALQASLS